MIATERAGVEGATTVLCLHGWPGGVSDYRLLTPLLAADAAVVVPHLLGFGDSFAPGDELRPPADFGREAQVEALVGLLDVLDPGPVVVVGYDVGITTAIALAREVPSQVRGLVLGNVLAPSTFTAAALDGRRRAEFWYQDFHQTELCARLMDGNPAAVRTYLEYFWSHWGARPDAVVDESLVEAYARPGAFTAGLNWYRSGASTLYGALAIAEGGPLPEPVDVPARVLWGALDPLFPVEFASAVPELLPRASVQVLDDVGHFTPIEAAAEMADAVREFL